MRIGIPREIKTLEGRVGLVPAACAELIKAGHTVFVETNAGMLSGYSDDSFRNVGVHIARDAAALYGQAELIVKVKEPVAPELDLLRREHVLFSYLHLAPAPALTQRLVDIGLTAVAFETVEEGGLLPLLAPMSDIAGRLAIQIGANLLQHPQGGKGLLLGGLPAAERGKVVVLGAGVAGGNAASMAADMGANVIVFDPKREKLERVRALGRNVTGLYPFTDDVRKAVAEADLVVGAVLVTGEKAPHVIDRATVARMAKGSVIVDISVDQGGCVETTRATTYADPTYVVDGVTHFCVTNMPGAVPRSASQALSAALIPYVRRLAEPQWQDHAGLRLGINIEHGQIVHSGLRRSLGL
ncbi:MAG: alanine dehydrogenase [Pseudomonadota bacterium]